MLGFRNGRVLFFYFFVFYLNVCLKSKPKMEMKRSVRRSTENLSRIGFSGPGEQPNEFVPTKSGFVTEIFTTEVVYGEHSRCFQILRLLSQTPRVIT